MFLSFKIYYFVFAADITQNGILVIFGKSMLRQTIYQYIITQKFVYKLIEIMPKSNCRAIVYKKNHQQLPQERWGHSLTRVGSNELVMYGGFGGSKSDGHYLDDLWSYNIKESSWTQVSTFGQKPEPRSNYSFHYNDRNNEIVLFGGGSDAKCRFNSICILDWQTKFWRKIHPSQSSVSPWERTYHSSEFVYPYLIVFGGESAHGIDLNDLWAFNIQKLEWRQVQMKADCVKPMPRRFQTSAFLDGYFYAIAGCTGNNYQLLGDIYRVNLLKLIEKGVYQNFYWECVIEGEKVLQKWGHSTNLYNGKMYISLGRVNSSEDTFETVVFDPKNRKLTKLQLKQDYTPKSRRRHASVIVGNSLLIYGGYNGQYLQDFQYIQLDRQIQYPSTQIETIMCQSLQKMKSEIVNIEQQMVKDLKIKLVLKGRVVGVIETRKVDLINNRFFKNMLDYSVSDNDIFLKIEKESDKINLRMINCVLTKNTIPFCKKLNIEMIQSLLQSIEYFCAFEIMPVVENFLIEITTSKNCLKMYRIAYQYKLDQLRELSIQLYVTQNYKAIQEELLNGNEKSYTCLQNNASDVWVSNEDLQSYYSSFKGSIIRAFENVKFDVIQTKMREENTNFFFKTTQKLKSLILRKRANIEPSIKDNREAEDDVKPKDNIFMKFVKFVGRMCMKQSIQGQSQQ